MKKVLVSFVGTNDRGDLPGHGDGAILTVFKERQFDETHLLWCHSDRKDIDYKKIAETVRDRLLQRRNCRKVKIHHFPCRNVTDHNEIYRKLQSMCKKQFGYPPQDDITAAIASGTPSMQACWILLAESGDFPLALIRSNEAQFGRPRVKQVTLGTSLPRIISLDRENTVLKKENADLNKTIEKSLPQLTMWARKGIVKIGKQEVHLAPMEFAYYRYFLARALREDKPVEIRSDGIEKVMSDEILNYHKEAFMRLELPRQRAQEVLEDRDISVKTLRAHASRISKKIRSASESKLAGLYFQISVEGSRGAKTYCVKAPKERIKIIESDLTPSRN